MTEVWLKIAVSLDGRIATRTGRSQWITSKAARARGRALRGEVDAILVGRGTVEADDPRLTARAPGTSDPIRLVMDSRLSLSARATLVRTARETPTWVLTTRAAPATRRATLEAAGVEVLTLRKTRAGRVDPKAAVAALEARGVRRLLVEGGAEVAGAFCDAGLVDRVFAFVAPVLIGGAEAPGAIGGRGPARLEDALRLVSPRVETLGSDVLVSGRVRPREKRGGGA